MMPVRRTQSWLPSIFNDFFDNEWMTRANATAPAINVIESEKDYKVEVAAPGMTKEDVAELRSQEKFNSAYVVNASIGKNWFIKRQYTLGFSLEMKNLLNDQDIKTGGYEQVRLLKNKDTSYQTYQPFDSKYFYMFGSTYYLNLYFRF